MPKTKEIYHVGRTFHRSYCGLKTENIIRDRDKATPYTVAALKNLEQRFNRFAVICKKCISIIKNREDQNES